jgi:hypothetical protein
MRENMWPLSCWTWITSLNMIFSIPFLYIYLRMTKFHFALWLNKIPLCICIYIVYVYMYTNTYTCMWYRCIYKMWYICVYMCVYIYHIFLFHSSVVGYLVCFHSLTIVNNATIKMGVQHMGGMGLGRKPKTWKCLMSPLQRS